MLISLAIIFIFGLLLGAMFKKIGLPSLVGMILAGIIVSKYGLNILDESIMLINDDLRKIALIVILLKAGLSLDIRDLKKIGTKAILLSFLPACFEITATTLIAPLFFDLTYLESFLLGTVIASASPAVIVPRMTRLIDEQYGTKKLIPQMILAGDSVDDVFNIVLFSIVLGLNNGEKVDFFQVLIVPSSIILGVLLGIIGGFSLIFLFKKIKMDDIYKLIIVLSLAFMFVGLEDLLEGFIPVSGLLAVLVLGVSILAKNGKLADRFKKNFSNLWLAFEVILFVLLGAIININFAKDYIFYSILLLVIVLFIRGIGIILCVTKSNLNKKEKLFMTFSGIPKATVQAAISAIPLQMGLPCGEVILAISVIAILFSAPVGAFILDFSYNKLLEKEQS